jgi:flavin reductase (DIM6/NTAB) family NADH-FMN oxidoreductase RutF
MPAPTRRLFLTTATTLVALVGARSSATGEVLAAAPAAKGRKRVPLPRPGPMLPPVPAILTTVNGKPGEPDEISVLWTFVVNGDPPQVGVSAGDEHRAGALIALHREFVLNVPVAAIVERFDTVDMSSSKVADKFALSGLTRGKATVVNAPTVEESPIQVECRVTHTVRVPPSRTVYLADVVATTVHEGVCDENGRLRVAATELFGMTAGSGEFYTMGREVGHIGQTVGRRDIRY